MTDREIALSKLQHLAHRRWLRLLVRQGTPSGLIRHG